MKVSSDNVARPVSMPTAIVAQKQTSNSAQTMAKAAAYLLAALVTLGAASKSGAAPVLEQIGEFTVPEANQGVGVDARHF